MALIRESDLKIVDIPVDDLHPNSWNANRMDDATFAKLRAYVEREGLVEPLIVRPAENGYELLGGYHRWRAAQDLGWETVPCVVVKVDDNRARILSINLNELHGQTVPHLLAEIVHDLNRELSLEDISTQLPYDEAQLGELQDLLRLPDGLDLDVEQEVEEMKSEATKVLSFPLSPEQHEVVCDAVEHAKEKLSSRSRSAGITRVAKRYLEHEKQKVTDSNHPEGGVND